MMNKTWLITGASAGLGRLMTERLLQRGDRVVATARRTEAFNELQAQHGALLTVMSLDVADPSAIRTVAQEAFSKMGRIDVAVSNAAYGLFGAAEEATDEQIQRQIATNLLGSIQFVRATLPHLRAQGGGRIVQVSSEGGQIAYPSFSVYHATKWGIEGFIESVAQEVAKFGIDFLVVEPGPTGTRFAAGLDHTLPMPEYEHTPAGEVRRALTSGTFSIKGDAVRTVDAMIAAADSETAPFRLVLGSTAYENVVRELSKRLDEVKGQRDVAYSADY